MNVQEPENIVVVHLSSTAVHTVVGQVYALDDIHIVGFSSVPSHDFVDGIINNRDRLKANIKQSIQLAEDMANCRINSVWLSFTTPELKSVNGMGEVSIDNDKIEAKDMVNALSNAKNQFVGDNMYLVSHVQQGVILDNEPNMVDDVVGMQANELAVLYHLMMMPVKSCHNLQQLLQDCHVTVDQMIFDVVSSAEYGLLADEKSQGVCLIDIGASNTNVCIYRENKLVYTHCYPFGGNDVSYDIAVELDITPATAEMVKRKHGNINLDDIDTADFFEIKDIKNEKRCNRKQLYNIIEARYRQILGDIKKDLDKQGLSEFLHEGYVVAGGATKIAGFIPYAKNILSAKVHLVNRNTAIKVGLPYYGVQDDKIQEQIYACLRNSNYHTAFGVLLYSQSDTFFYSKRSDFKTIRPLTKSQKILAKLSRLSRKIF